MWAMSLDAQQPTKHCISFVLSDERFSVQGLSCLFHMHKSRHASEKPLIHNSGTSDCASWTSNILKNLCTVYCLLEFASCWNKYWRVANLDAIHYLFDHTSQQIMKKWHFSKIWNHDNHWRFYFILLESVSDGHKIWRYQAKCWFYK